tara:strand:+ start:106 stop:492 length:387 start_codon:yes stop_codon:yes gene_type:complete
MPRVKKTEPKRLDSPRSIGNRRNVKTVSEDGNTFTKTKPTILGNKKKIVSYKTNEDGTVTKTVTKTKDQDYLAGSKGTPVNKSTSKVKREKTMSAEKAARQKKRREKRVKNQAEMRDPNRKRGPSLPR